MDKLDRLLQEIYENEIKIVNFHTEEIIGAAVEFNQRKRIILNKDKIKNRTHEHTVLAHEFYHFKTGTLYRLEDSQTMKDKKEYKCDKYMVQKLVPIDKLKDLISKKYSKFEIAFFFEVDESVIEKALYIYRVMNLL